MSLYIKKDDDTNLSNYRLISLLPSISKIFENVILEQLSTYLDNNNLIHKHQYGFRKHHSTECATLHIVDYLNYEMDLKRTPINLYLDLSKAFDSLFHEILLSKLKHYGIYDAALNLIKSYLENRKQYVQFDYLAVQICEFRREYCSCSSSNSISSCESFCWLHSLSLAFMSAIVSSLAANIDSQSLRRSSNVFSASDTLSAIIFPKAAINSLLNFFGYWTLNKYYYYYYYHSRIVQCSA